MRRMSAWLTQRRAADASKAGNRETGYIGSRAQSAASSTRGHPATTLDVPPAWHAPTPPGITGLRIELPRGGDERARED